MNQLELTTQQYSKEETSLAIKDLITKNPYKCSYTFDNIEKNLKVFSDYVALDKHRQPICDLFNSLTSEDSVDNRILKLDALVERYINLLDSNNSTQKAITEFYKNVAILGVLYAKKHGPVAEFYNFVNERKNFLALSMHGIAEEFDRYIDTSAFDCLYDNLQKPINCSHLFLYSRIAEMMRDNAEYFYFYEDISDLKRQPLLREVIENLNALVKDSEYWESELNSKIEEDAIYTDKDTY